MSYIYFDVDGRLREYVTTPKRKGSENVDTLFVYWEGNDGTTVLPSQCFIEYGHEKVHAGPLVADAISKTIIPFDRERDLKFFQYGKTYQFMCFNLPTAVSSTSGFWHSSVSIHDRLSNNVVQVLGDITFEVEESSIVPSGSLDLSQYNYLLDAIRENRIIYDSNGNVSAKFTDSGLQITGSSLTLNDETWGFTKVSKKGTDGTKRSVGMLLYNFLYDSGASVDLGSALLLTDTRQVFALGDEDIECIELTKGEIVVSEETANYLTSNRVDLSAIPDWIGERYVSKLGAGSDYRVYMVSPDGTDTKGTVSSSAINGAVPLRTSTGQLELPDQNATPPSGTQAISKSYADAKYDLDRKTTDFHSVTTLRWLNDNNQREMVINGSWVGFYSGGNQLLILRGDIFTYLDKTVKWSDLADLTENKAPLLNGDKGTIGSYKSDGNGISSATTFAGSNISNTAKGINSFSLGRLNAVEGVGCFAYGNKNTVKGAGSVALGGGNVSGDRIDWTSASASVNNSSAYCISLGENNTTIGRSAVSIGISNNSQGDGSISVGRGNTIWSKESVAIGRSNTLNKVSTGSYDEQEPDQGNGVVAIGTGLMTPKRWNNVNLENLYWNCVVVGRYNDPYVYGCARSTDLPYKNNCAPVFTLGNGSDDSNRRNSIVTFHNSGFQERRYDWTYINDCCIFNQICEFRNANNIFENNITVWGIVKDKNGVQYLKGGQISDTFINSLF